jgi:hypothetical protein
MRSSPTARRIGVENQRRGDHLHSPAQGAFWVSLGLDWVGSSASAVKIEAKFTDVQADTAGVALDVGRGEIACRSGLVSVSGASALRD